MLVRGTLTTLKDKKYKLRLSVCPRGEKALDLFHKDGLMIVMSTTCRFASACPIPEEPWSNSPKTSQ